MTDKFTPAMALAAASLLENRGISVSKPLVTAIDKFNNSSIVAACQQKLSSTSTPEDVVNAIKSLPYCLTGAVPRTMSASISTNIKSQFNLNNLVLDVKSQADAVMANGVLGLIGITNEVIQFCITSFYLKGYMDEVKVARFRDYGFAISNYKDEITGGVNSQYSHLEGGISNPSYQVLFTQVGNFGTLFNIKNLFGLNDPRVLCTNLVDQGFTKIVTYLSNFGIDYQDIDNASTEEVLAALETVQGTDLKSILSITKFVSYATISTLADVFNIDKVLSPAAVVAAGGSMESLANKLVNIGGDFDSFEDLKTTYLSIADTNLKYLNSFSDHTGNIEINAEHTSLGSGTDTFSNPTMFDVLGCVTGQGYLDEIQALVDIQDSLKGLTIESDLLQALASNDADKINQCKNYIVGNTDLAAKANAGNRNFRSIFKRLLTERKNIVSAGVDIANPQANITSLYAFIITLSTSYDQLPNLRVVDFIKAITTDDPYGESVIAVIDEGINTNLLSLKNIPTYAYLDPVSYSQVKQESLLNCVSFDANDPNDLNNPNNPNSPFNIAGQANTANTQTSTINNEFTVIPNCADWNVVLTAETFVVTNENYNLPDQCVVWEVSYNTTTTSDCFTVTPEFVHDYWCVAGEGSAYEYFTITEYPPTQVPSTWTLNDSTNDEIVITEYPLGQTANQKAWTINIPPSP